MPHLIRDAFSPLFLIGVRVNDLVPQRTKSHVGSLDKHNRFVLHLHILHLKGVIFLFRLKQNFGRYYPITFSKIIDTAVQQQLRVKSTVQMHCYSDHVYYL